MMDDYISRSAAIEKLQSAGVLSDFGKFLLEELPAAHVVEVRHGYNVDREFPSLFQCSVCQWECYDTVPGDTETYNYCPNCGARMDGGADHA